MAKISKKLRIKWNFELTVFELTVLDLYGFRFEMTYDGRTFIFVHLDRDIESKYVLCLVMSFNERK